MVVHHTASGVRKREGLRRAFAGGKIQATIANARAKERPDWNPSRQIFSYRRTSSVTGRPHSSSW